MRAWDRWRLRVARLSPRPRELSAPEQVLLLERLVLVLILAAAVSFLAVWTAAAARVSRFRTPTLVVDRDGLPWFNLHDPLGTHMRLEQMPPHLVQAVIAVEDRRFYRHGAFDLRGVVRAAWQNLRSTGIRQGASTLSQQLARQLFLTHRRTVWRKLQEAVLASELESQFRKDEILEAYLNRVFMGGSLYGMPAAARYFFGKEITRVTLAEAAALAGAIRAPNFYNPQVNPQRILGRRDLVLRLMREQGYLGEQQYRQALREQLRFVRVRAVGRTETYFKEFVRAELAEVLGEEVLDEYGYRVHTGYSPTLQALAESAANQEILRMESTRLLHRYPDRPALQVALVSLEADTGRIHAMVGGRNYGGSQYNHVTQALRQPGSAFKPILYAAALAAGMTPASRIQVAPEEPPANEELAAPEALPELTLREALTRSVNSAAVALIEKVGVATTVQFARRFGIRSPLPQVTSLALGSGEVRVLDLTAAYTAFASGGWVAMPHSIVRVEDATGSVVYRDPVARIRAVSPEVAYQMATMLGDVVSRGTAAGSATAGIPFPIAGKTGTTNDYRDAWFVGFSRSLVCGVWVGYDNPRPIMPGGYGARLALPIWGRYMRGTAPLVRHGRFAVPETLRPYRLCRVTGLAAGDGCNVVMRPDGTIHSTVYTEHLLPETAPVEVCPLHGTESRGGLVRRMLESLRRLLPGAAPAGPPRGQPGQQDREP